MHLYFKPLTIVALSIAFQLTACSGGSECADATGSSAECGDTVLKTGEAQETTDGGAVETDTAKVETDTANVETDTAIVDTGGTVDVTDSGTGNLDTSTGTSSTGGNTDSGITAGSIIETQSRASAGLAATPDPSGPFSKFQLDDMLYTNNVYDGRQLNENDNYRLISYAGVQDFVKWRIPVSSDANGDLCSQTQPLSDVFLNYRLTSKKDSEYEKNTFVRSFPAMVVGTMGGRYESWGVECGNSSQITYSAQRTGSSPVYDMARVASETGFPKLARDMNSSVLLSVKGDIHSGVATNGIANVFVDTYWHNVSDIELLPGQDISLVNTINGINSDVTETWNLNIWFDWPRHEGSVASWTGGFKIGQVGFSDNQLYDVYFKLEGARTGLLPDCRLGGEDNCFLYIGLVTTDLNAARDGITLDYLEVSNWLKSAAFRDLFLSGAGQTGTPNADAYAVWKLIDGTANDNNPDPASRGPRFPDDHFVIGGFHMGSELWFNPDAHEAEIRFSTFGIHVENVGTFGSFQDFR